MDRLPERASVGSGTRVGPVGRDAELAAIDSFLGDPARPFIVLTLRGPPGIGKTTVWARGLARAKTEGAMVLSARPAENEVGMSFAGLADVLATVPTDVRGGLPPPQRDALAAALLETPAPPKGIDERALCASVVSLLRVLAAQRPVVVAVDDAQWLDSPSARVLGFVMRRLDADPVRFLVAQRSAERQLDSFDLAAHPGRRRVVEVGPLNVAALHEIIKSQTGSSLPRPTLVRIARVSAGNPFYALEIASELQRQGTRTSELPLPASLQALVERKLGRLPQPTRRALLAVAALSHPAIDTVGKAALVAAETEGIVSIEDGDIRFVHPLFASAVYFGADAPARRRLHRRLARLAADPEQRTRHLALAAARPDESIASQLDEVARSAARRGAPAAAAELASLALGLTPGRHLAQRDARRLAEARYLFDLGDLERALTLAGLAAAASGPGTFRAQVLQLLGRIHARRNTFTEALRLAFEALNEAGDHLELRIDIELDVTYCCVSLGDWPAAADHATAAAASAGAQPAALADALAVMTMADFLCGKGVDNDRMACALAMEDRGRPRAFQMQPRFIHGLLLLWTGRLEEARSTLEALRADAAERGEEAPVPFLCLY